MNVVLVFLFVVSKVMCNIPQSEEDPRILIIGGTIRGRFKLGSSLLGRDTNRKRKQGECFSSLFPTCIEKGSWLGEDNLNITIIDTPTYHQNITTKYPLIITDFLQTLAEKIKFVNVVIFMFDQWETSMSFHSKMLLSSLYSKFGGKVWEHAILLTPNWSYSKHRQSLRTYLNISERSWASAINEELQREFKVKNELPSIFLDCTKRKKTENFRNEAERLMNFIQTKSEKLFFKDIEMTLSEVKTLNRKIEILVDSNEKRHYRIQELEMLVNEPENSKIKFLALVIFSGSISLGVIIALIMVCIGCFKKKARHYNSEGSQGSNRSYSAELQVLAECLAHCGYSTEEIGRIQQIMSEA